MENNMWHDKLKELGVCIHVIATGAGAGIQNILWSQPGCSNYLSGASFPYATEEQEELLGFMPEHFCSEEAAIDLASAAYMKAYRFGGKKPVGLGLTASVASEKEHRGDHRIFACIITDDKIRSSSLILEKGVGKKQRLLDGEYSGDLGLALLINTLCPEAEGGPTYPFQIKNTTELAKERFLARPFFSDNGKRFNFPSNFRNYMAMMPGAFNPPHEGHFGIVRTLLLKNNIRTVFEITAETPHKGSLSVQDMLKRAKHLKGYDVLFTRNLPLYLDKIKALHYCKFIVGADAMLRMLDPKWGIDPLDMLNQISNLGTTLMVVGREINGKYTTHEDITKSLEPEIKEVFERVTLPVLGRWDISSTELRNKI